MLKQWYNTELPLEQTSIFRKYLLDHGYDYEISEVGTLRHIEINLYPAEAREVSQWIADNFE